MSATVKLYSLNLSNVRTYLFAALFIIGNMLFPQLAHFIPGGGLMLLPIYFFTLIGAYKYGLHVGILTAVLSPMVNSLLFGMPVLAVVPAIMFKSIILAVAAALAARYFGKVSIWGILIAILAYQLIGTGFEWILVRDFSVAIQDFRIGFPGMIIQLFGGYLVLKALQKV